jgi:hypothetical protein
MKFRPVVFFYVTPKTLSSHKGWEPRPNNDNQRKFANLHKTMKTICKLNCLAAALCAFFITQSSQAQPTIGQNPRSEGLYAGRTLSLSVQATGTSTLTYQWMAGATGSGTYSNLGDGGNVSGTTTSNLVITGVSAANAADYVVVVTDGTGSTSALPATLSIVAAPTDSYASAVLADNPVAFWRLNETSGTTASDYAGGFNGLYHGTAGPTGYSLNQAGPPLAHGATNSVSFTGNTGNNVFVPWYPELNPPLLTVECWVAPPSALPTSGRRIMIGTMADTTNNTLNDAGYYMSLEGTSPSSADHFGWTVGSGKVNESNQVNTTNACRAAKWVHLVGTYDGNTAFLYTNGILAGSTNVPYVQNLNPNVGPIPGVNSNTYPHVFLGIGSLMNATGPGAGFLGNLCDVAIYNTALSGSQVMAHYAQGVSGGLVAPSFTKQPQSVSLYAGQTATFSAQFTAYSPSGQWLAGAHGSGVYTNFANADVSGLSTSSLVITNISAANAGDYLLVISNPSGSVTSSVVTLTVQAAPTDVYGVDVLADNPVAYWRLNETSGTTAYDWIGGHNGVYQGGVTLNQSGISSFDTTGAASFDGTSAYVQVPYSSALNTPKFTVECWVDQTGGTGNQQAPLANQNGGSGYDFYSYPASPDQWDFQVSPGSYAFGTGGVAVNHWTHLAGTFDGNNQILYVNGVPVVTNQVTGFTVNSAAPLNLGAGNNDQSSPAYYWTGLINEVAVYGAALTPNQILKHYDLATTGTVPAPVITQQPQGLNLYSNQTAAFSVQAQSLVTPSYQWMAGATGSGVYTNLLNAGNVSGVTTTKLVITGVSVTNAADYVVVVSHSYGSTTSSVATLTVVTAPTDLYGGLVMADGPAAYWRMNETNGTVMHDYVGNHNGVYQGGVTLNQPGISTYDTNPAVRFDGSSGYAQVPNSPALNTTSFSVECWLKPNENGGTMTAIGNVDSVNTAGWDLTLDPNNLNFMVQSPYLFAGPSPLSGSVGALSQWTHVVATYQSPNMTLYVNGTLLCTNSPATDSGPGWLATNSAWPLNIGAGNNDQSTPANFWSGLMSEVAIYQKALTPTQVKQHYVVAALGGYAPPIIVQSATSLQRYATMTASFTGQATSFLPSMTYQWMAGATGSGTYTNLVNAGNISGVATTNLVITNLAVANAADYVFVAQNAAGSVTSSVATLSVQPAPSDAYGAAVVSNNPVAFWRLNETSGTTTYDYCGGYNGTYNTVTLNQTGPGTNTANVSALFDGSSAHNVTIPWSAALNPALLTVECWVAPGATLPSGANNKKVIIGTMADTTNSGNADAGYWLEVDYNTTTNLDRYAMGVGAAAGWTSKVIYQCAAGSANLKPYQWMHLVGTYDGTTETLYTNGVKASSLVTVYYPNLSSNVGSVPGAANTLLYPHTYLGIGSLMNATGPGAGFNGYIADAAIYNKPLTAYQVLNQYKVGTTGSGVAAPVFALQPQPVATNAGSTVSLVGQATFAMPLTYQWMVQSNGAYVNLANGGSISGATTTNLVITSAASANATNYVLVASYPGISVTSSAATLTVTAPVVQPPISLTSAYVGGALTLNWTNSAYTLMQATNVMGPWVRTTNLSGYQVSSTNSQMYFRLVSP